SSQPLWRVFGGDLVALDGGVRQANNQDAPASTDHVDRGLVQLRQRSTGEHLVDGAGEGLAGGQVEDGIDHVQDGIDVVGDHHHGAGAPSPAGVAQGGA